MKSFSFHLAVLSLVLCLDKNTSHAQSGTTSLLDTLNQSTTTDSSGKSKTISDSTRIILKDGLSAEELDLLIQNRMRKRLGDSIYSTPYTFSLGASFNFLDGLKANDLYADLNVFLPQVWKIGNSKSRGDIGIEFGFSQGRSFTSDTLLLPNWPIWLDTDSTINQISINRFSSSQSKNLTLNLSVMLSVFNNLSIGTYSEIRKSDSESKITYRSINADSLNVSLEPFRIAERNYSYMFGLGPVFNHTQ